MTTTESSNLNLVQQIYADFAPGNVESILAATDANIEWISGGSREDFPTLGPRKGIEGAASFFKDVAEHDEFSSFEPKQMIAMGDMSSPSFLSLTLLPREPGEWALVERKNAARLGGVPLNYERSGRGWR